jgi:hypothetical protein
MKTLGLEIQHNLPIHIEGLVGILYSREGSELFRCALARELPPFPVQLQLEGRFDELWRQKSRGYWEVIYIYI